jgi:adenine-specific DNA-methyltransferase
MTAPGDATVTDTDLPDRFDLASEVPIADGIAAIHAAFPEVVRDGKVDFDALRRSLGYWIEPGPERFGLTWPGKAECMRVIQEPSIGTLVPMPDESIEWDTTQNVIIEGDNLEVLKLTQKAYYGKVKMIYIDPPYNTGKEFIYPDNYREGLADYLFYSGQTDEEGVKLTANAETDGRYHSKWLSMMYPRLFLARNLLADDGLIFVSIDDHEVHHLRSMMAEIFGEEAFVGTLVWQAKKGGGSDNAGLVVDHEYVMVFARSRESLTLGTIRFEPAPLDRTDDRGRYRRGRELNKWGSNSLRSDRPTMYFPIPGPDGQDVYPIRTDGKEGCWRKGRPEMMRLVKAGDVEFAVRSDGRLGAFEKVRSESPASKPFRTWLTDVGTTADGTKRLKTLFEGTAPFPYPKPVALLDALIAIGVGDDPDALVLDFFAGSGTLGDAVAQYNVREETRLRYLLIQLPEVSDDGMRARELSSITRERMRWVGREAESAASQLSTEDRNAADYGFRAYRLCASNFSVWESSVGTPAELSEQLELSVDNVVPGSNEERVLTELLLKAGYPLTSAIADVEFGGVPGFSVADGALLVCLSAALTIQTFEDMVEHEPAMILVLDAGFEGSDELKVNALQTVRARNAQSGTDIALRVV